MYKRLIIFLAFSFLFFNTIIAQTVEWTEYINGSANDSDVVNNIITDASGNIYIVGSTKETETSYDVLTAKFDIDGNLKWSQTYGFPGDIVDLGYGIDIDSDRNVYSLGYTNDSGMISVIKYDSNGVFQWANSFAGELCGSRTIVVDNSDHVFIAGLAMHIARFGPDGDTLFISGGTEMWPCPVEVKVDNENNYYVIGYDDFDVSGLIVKYDSLGNEQWRNWLYDDCGGDYTTLFVTGAFDSNWNIIAGGGHGPAGCAQTQNYFLRKYSPDGDTLWTEEYIVPSGDGQNVDIVVDYDTLFTTGIFIPAEGVLPSFIKYSPTGTLLWDESYDRSTEFERSYVGAAALTDDYIYNFGYCDSVSGSPDNYEFEVVCYNRNGSFEWAYHADGVSSLFGEAPDYRSISIGYDIASLPGNEVVFAGTTDNSPSGTEDIVIRKLSLGGGSSAPQIVSVFPPRNESNVDLNENIIVTFDMRMKEATISDNSFIVSGSYSGLIGGSIAYDDNYYTATFEPTLNFQPGEIITVSLTKDIDSKFNGPLEESQTWQFRILAGPGSVVFTNEYNYPTPVPGSFPISAVAFNVNNDNFIDLAIANEYMNNVSIYLGAGDGSFTYDDSYPVGTGVYCIVAVDLDGDGNTDIVSADNDADSVTVLLNNGDDTFSPDANYFAGIKPNGICAGDFDGDGSMDAAICGYTSNDITILFGDRHGELAAAGPYATGTNPFSICSGDFNGDGFLDLATANYNSSNISVLLNDKTGAFNPQSTYDGGTHPSFVTCADIDGDNDLDLITADDSPTGQIRVLRNNGYGVFSSQQTYTVDSGPLAIAVSDWDGDTDLDLAVANAGSDVISILINNGTGGYSVASDFLTGNGPYSIAYADFDSDGDMDFVTADRIGDNISIFLNKYAGEIIVSNLNDAGGGSLRWAIDSANIDVGLNTIVFNTSGTITPVSQLPSLTDDSTIIFEGALPGSIIIDGGSFSKANEYGLTIFSNFNRVKNLVLTDWTGGCIKIDGDSNNVINCNIGVNSAGDTRNNRGNGLEINGNYNEIGGCGPDERNLFGAGPSSSLAHILITGDTNTVNNAYLGIDTDGDPMTNVASQPYGIKIDGGHGNIIGDESCPNYMGGFNTGFLIQGSDQNIIKYNQIGLSPNMTDTIPCQGGMYITTTSSQNTIGPGNIVAGNDSYGIYVISINADSNVFIGNTIIGNEGNGITASSGATANRIGGYSADEKNTIAYNQYDGVGIVVNSEYNEVVGNIIENNGRHGIMINDNGSYNLIDSNIIRYNAFDGIASDTNLWNCQYNTFTGNLVYGNDSLGIDLFDDGVTLNDIGDTDTGPNDMLNYPEIDSLFMNPDSTYRVYGTAADSSIIEFFVAHPEGDTSKPADPSGYGEAYSYIGSDTADNNGDFEYQIDNTVPYFSMITVTATDTLGNTSEFAPNFYLIPTPLIIVGYSPINLQVIDPAGDSIGKLSDNTYFNTIKTDATYDDIVHDSINIQYPLEGEYIIIVHPQGDPPPGQLYSIGIRIDGSLQVIIVENADVPVSGTADTLGYEVIESYHFNNGDASRDDTVNLIDILYLIAYLYDDPPGPPPYPLAAGDANCDRFINLIDILYLIANLYNDPPGPAPCQLDL